MINLATSFRIEEILKLRLHSKLKIGDKTKKTQTINLSNAIIYYLSVPIIYLVSYMPFISLYFFSDLLYFIMYSVIGYRRKIVQQNLRNSFPGKTDAEINTIGRRFYHHLSDCLLEIIKTITINKKELINRCDLTAQAHALFSKFADERKNIIIVMGHTGNWEWACNTFNILCRQQLYVIYHPVRNEYFDMLMHNIRARNGTRLIRMKDTYKEMVANKAEMNATAFVADQAPPPDNAYWTTFLNQDTPVFKGVEIIAKKMDLPVIYASVKKVKRGYYKMYAEVLAENAKDTIENEISELYTRRLEQDIIRQPEIWLWSHRRWKHKRVNLHALELTNDAYHGQMQVTN